MLIFDYYVKKPVTIRAMRWDPERMLIKDVMTFMGISETHPMSDTDILSIGKTSDSLIIKTLEGNMTVSPGDYIIEGVRGEYYPCKPDIFMETYTPYYQKILRTGGKPKND